MLDEGVVYIAYGDKANHEVSFSIKELRLSNPDLKFHIINQISQSANNHVESRRAKTMLDQYSPFDLTCYLDADTRPQKSIQSGFEILNDGFDLVITPSDKQESDCLWHVSEDERKKTFDRYGIIPLQLQAGVFYFRKSTEVLKFFKVWREEWSIYRGEDQAAFLRAMHRVKLKIWLLGRPWNGGAVVQHLYGRCRG